jgi:hypothetical protein
MLPEKKPVAWKYIPPHIYARFMVSDGSSPN